MSIPISQFIPPYLLRLLRVKATYLKYVKKKLIKFL